MMVYALYLLAVVCVCGIYAAWDIAKRRIEVMRVNDLIRDRLEAVERTHADFAKRLNTVNEKFEMTRAAQANRTPLRGIRP